jgi:RNA polymerase sigma-70 factor, ECF subfamily
MAVIRAGHGDELEHIEPCGSLATAEDSTRTHTREHDDPGRLMEGLRQYLLMMANQVIGPELRAKVGPSDLVQETFLAAQEHLDGFQGRSEPEIRAWLRKILECRLANLRRAYLGTEKRAVAREVGLGTVGVQSGEARVMVATRAPSPSNHAVRNERAEALEKAMHRLPEHYRQAVAWRCQDGLSWDEIGLRMSCTAEAARKVWSRAIVQLKREVGERDERRRN